MRWFCTKYRRGTFRFAGIVPRGRDWKNTSWRSVHPDKFVGTVAFATAF